MSQQRIFIYILLAFAFCMTFEKVLAQESKFVVNEIVIEGNKRTKPQIIFRELAFHINDTLNNQNIVEKIKKSEENLLNTSLFNFVTITYKTDSNVLSFHISLKERWYTWPNPILEISDRNFNTWVENKNWDHINYGFYLSQENVRGRKETLRILFRKGYREEFGLSYMMPSINRKQTIGINVSSSFSQNHEIPVSAVNNKVIFYKTTNFHVFKQYANSVMLTYRPNIYNTSSVRLNYTNIAITDSVHYLYPDFFEKMDKRAFFTFAVRFKQDCRDSKAYPLKGHLLDIEVVKEGLGLLKNELNQLYTAVYAKKFAQINNRLFYGVSVGTKISEIPSKSYYFQRSLGYGNDFVRGYEYYVIDGQNFVLAKTNFKYNLLPTKIKSFSWIPLKKFNTLHYALYSNIFFDCGYVKDIYFKRNNQLNNSFIYGLGIGLDFVTYYDKVLRVEYSINKQKEQGIFIHFIAPI